MTNYEVLKKILPSLTKESLARAISRTHNCDEYLGEEHCRQMKDCDICPIGTYEAVLKWLNKETKDEEL